MRTTTRAALFVLFASPLARAFAQQPKAPEPHTAAAVIADDDAWGKAEQSGDAAFVDTLLLPQYRSIDAAGKTHDKAAILTSTRKASPQRDAMIASWKAAHPSLTSVELNGDTAILTFTLNKPGTPPAIMSCDIFVYREGHWHALYSQHTTAGA